MEKEKLIPWIEKLNKAEKKERGKIVDELAKENSVKPAEAWKLLKEAGFDPKENPQDNPQTENNANAKKQPVVLRHKTEYPRYRRAGLVLTQMPETYEVTDAQLALLEKDPWVVVGKDEKGGTGA